MFRIIGFGIVFFLWLVFIKALQRIIRISRRKKAYPYAAYSYKYDPIILEKDNIEGDLQFYHYKTNIPKSNLKEEFINSDLVNMETNIFENRGV